MHESGKQIVREWLDGLDDQLAAEARRAGLSGHPTMIGDHREGAFARALRDFLPPLVQVGSGKVFDSAGTMSAQTDVVLHDARYPVFRQGQSCLFPVEGVIATIEIKSVLDTASLLDAWNKCVSISALRHSVAGEDCQVMEAKLEARGIPTEERQLIVGRTIRPTTYIYAYEGLTTLPGFMAAFDQVRGEAGIPFCPKSQSPIVPSVVASGGVIGLAWGDPVRVFPGDGQPPIPANVLPILISARSAHRFGVLAAHLLWRIETRTTLAEMHFGVRKSIMEYLPFETYLHETINPGPFAVSTVAMDDTIR